MVKIETWIQAVSTVGFPIVISFYVLGRLEPTINRLNDTIKFQSIIIAKQSGIDYNSIVQEYGGGSK
ncbi:MAG: YvrJ family protein [Bacteroidales bacterium]|nr:YvrJ family protein [Bacteroidales bacterium]